MSDPTACEAPTTTVEVGEGVRLHVRLKMPAPGGARRLLLLLPGTLVTDVLFTLPMSAGDPRDPMDAATARGYVALSPSYEGYAGSSQPADGRAFSLSRCLAHMAELVRWGLRRFEVQGVDVLGLSLGGSLAMGLAAHGMQEPLGIGKIVCASMAYKRFAPAAERLLLSPALRQMLEAAPHGYLQTSPPHYAPLLQVAGDDVRRWADTSFPGRYAVGPTLAGFALPLVDAAASRVPAMVIHGQNDPCLDGADMTALQEEYGGMLELLRWPQGGHAPTLEPRRAELWQRIFDFLLAPRVGD